MSIPVAPADKLVEKVVIEKLSRPDAADLITAPGKQIDVAGLRAELATCRARLEEIAADYDDDKINPHPRGSSPARSPMTRTYLNAAEVVITKMPRRQSAFLDVGCYFAAVAAWMMTAYRRCQMR